jgi:hypothetical protein
MRYAAWWVAGVALLLGVASLFVTRVYSPDRAEFDQGVATEFGVALLDLAITVGVVDFLLKRYSKLQRPQSIAARVHELIEKLRTRLSAPPEVIRQSDGHNFPW